ncbi:distal tail protein Dit [Melghirimyces algeriensis]|uniref:Putative phage tail component, N-terminal domain-containing protein n=1 Tax=Melghirimyces algeriensis TaxID=910412 RepID=A0A521FA33_9BACL|nr:distal tail protein Dit [Melghirimyces algeriensis]SMO93033.1 putative phage tail component, N-terminal domain-containing protein [Melghirimyces algeriensis]
MTGFNFNGEHSSTYNLTVLNIQRSFHAPVQPRLITAPGKRGAYNFNDSDVDMLAFDVQVLLLEKGNQEYHKTRRKIAQWLFTNEEKPLVFDDEPDKTYLAMLSGETNIDRIGSSGTAKITFVCSDPYARGETKTQRIANPGMVFRREGVRYREDGTVVTENYPVFKEGRFSQAVVIEEGTTNLLDTASYPVLETVSVNEGEDYFLSTVEGSAEIRHKRAYNISEENRRLVKAGKDIDTFINNETIPETDRVLDGLLYSTENEGTYSLQPEVKTVRSLANFGKKDIDPSIVIENPSDFDLVPPDQSGDIGNNPPTHGMEYTTDRVYTSTEEQSEFSMASPALGLGESSTIKLSHTFPEWSRDRQMVYRVYLEGNNNSGIQGNTFRMTIDGLGEVYYLDPTNPDVYNAWKFYYAHSGLMDNIKDGENRFYIGFRRGEGEGDFRGYLDLVYFEYKYDGYVLNGFAEFSVSLDGVKDLASAKINANVTKPEGTDVVFEVDTDGTGFVPYSIGDPIPGLSDGDDLTGKTVKIRISLSTTNDRVTPSVNGIKLEVVSGYITPKTVTLPVTDVSPIGIAKTSKLIARPKIPADTSILIEKSLDGGNTWSKINPGDTIVEEGTNLEGKQLALRYTLSTSDKLITPDIGEQIEWKIEQERANRITTATTEVELTPVDVKRWQLENKTYPTGWHPTGERKPETMYTPITDSLKSGVGTIGLWVYEDGHTVQNLRKILETDGGEDLMFFRSSDGSYSVRMNGETNLVYSAGIGWHYWVIRWDGLNADLFLDGQPVSSDQLSKELSLEYTEKLFVGCSASGTEQFNSLIDDLAIYSTVLTDTDIADIYNSGIPAEAEGESVVFPFDNSLYPQGSSAIEVDGTAPTPAVFRVTFSEASDHFKISNGYEYILISAPFQAGDVLEIDCDKQVVKKNGVPSKAMPHLSMDSDFFDLIPGGSVTVEPARITKVDATFTERWR